MVERRPMGALTDEIMAYLWAVDAPATPSEVHEAVAPELAYTTVMTILTRQWQKGALARSRAGRSYAYEPVKTEAEDRAERMHGTLGAATDRTGVLSRFVDSLTVKDAKTLRRLLDEGR